MWLAAANRRSRLSFWGRPPNRPLGTYVLYFVIFSTLYWGTVLLREDGRHRSALWFFPCVLVVTVAMLVPAAIHNRKVAQNRLTQGVALAAQVSGRVLALSSHTAVRTRTGNGPIGSDVRSSAYPPLGTSTTTA
jgi:hypothetical protein